MTTIPKETVFSADRRYRFTLWRKCPVGLMFHERPWPFTSVQFIGLNPSTADETADDHTIRRCRAFAAAWGFPWMCMTNLFAYRATQPQDMKDCPAPVGEGNTEWVVRVAKEAGLVVACWGTHGSHAGQDDVVRSALKGAGVKLHHLGLTKWGNPKHPARLPGGLEPTEWRLW